MKSLKIGKNSRGLFVAYRWTAGRVLIEPGEFSTAEACAAHFEALGHTIKGDL